MVDSIYRIASALESAKVITMDAAAIATSKLGETSYTTYSKNITPEQLSNLLNSRNPREIKDGMKRIISVMASGETTIDVESYFADVVKNIISDDAKVRIMVCIYLLRYAERDPNLALLSVNSIQKTLSDVDPETRCFSLKALSDMKIPSLFPVVLYTLKKAVTDPSASVRGEVAFSMLKLYREEGEEVVEELEPLLKVLLSDADPLVVSSAIVVLKKCFPQHLDWLHGHFRYYCEIMRELDPWAQNSMIDLLVSYCKQFLPRPTVVDASASADGVQSAILLPDRFNEIQFPVYDVVNHPDLTLFLQSLEPLIHSMNPSVILSSSNAFYQLATPMQFKKSEFPQALVRTSVFSNNIGVKSSLLQTILILSSLDSSLFLPYTKKFFVLPSDDTRVACLKLKILSNLINEFNVRVIVDQLKYYISTSQCPELVITAANTLAVCGQLSVRWESHVMKWFISHMETSKLPNAVLDSYVNVIRLLNPKRHLKTIMKLSEVLESRKLLADNVRAGIVWLFGEIAAVAYKICPDVLRKLIPHFSFEGPETRNQILLLAAKLLSYDIDNFRESGDVNEYDLDNSRIGQLYKAVAYLSEFDGDYDIRDRARCYSSLFLTRKFEIATLLLQAPKPSPVAASLWSPSSNGEQDLDWESVGLDKNLQEFHRMLPWNENIPETDDDLRKPAALKDYSRYKKSFSSDSFAGKNVSGGINSVSSGDWPLQPTSRQITATAAAAPAKKYRLQSLEEFFSDIPSKQTNKPKRKIVIESSSGEDDEESSSSDESESGDYRGDEDESSSSDESEGGDDRGDEDKGGDKNDDGDEDNASSSSG
ncbi:hypothetical protein ZYGR_0N03210 [Zygosaccharomyces rouxii]|uniref:ZYRO0D07656p n=2 Tax=Zygosaccharomyces rouxii TaxID=4956 RepID=C5DVL5_ZYGRC|nr:uncharacterized protein ZYRO0D07656g [Zygosaccharomyces rouxii]KAH9200746.1 adaptin N terminal region-domain-containing protein [Zygosaccharomyces rouxii]GAV48916.1 hypothetical protein ZYGR_0N03210 [Zygosaccharomyces rouxii]CAR27834.1 ZYRO0D07656p [Zygosaccharomyces rouxii]